MPVILPSPNANLYLVGFMGTGKSAVGRRVAATLNKQFIDIDNAIETKAGLSIKAIFEKLGEAHFRDLERQFIEKGHPDRDCIIACGGGLITQPGMIDLLHKRGIIVCLWASVDTILSRTSGNHKRPLLNTDNPRARIEKLLEERRPFYRKAGTSISTDQRTIADIAAHVIRIYRKQSKLS